MAPVKGAGELPMEQLPEYADFFEKLKAFHDERGTILDTNARVNGKHIDLYKLFKVVTQRGGYDIVSSEKLAWRKVGQEFNLGATNTAAYAFALKTVYYKNLAAYEIKTVHDREPPPKEILEDISAKGGDLLTRTVENFKPPQARENLANEQGSDMSGDEEHKTPKEEKMELDDPGSGGGRSTRGLRQAPPQRVLFQPNLSSSRQVRQSSGHLQSPQPHTAISSSYNHNPSSNPNSVSFSIANYEPRPQIPLTLRPVTTPGNNPAQFKENLRRVREATAAKLGKSIPSSKGMMLPGTGFEGPNIYVRTLNALRSGVPEEQDYALHHLVKISHERGDKYKFEAFPGLADGLIEKALEVSVLFYNLKWNISLREDEHTKELYSLDGINGTSDILQRIQSLQSLDLSDEMETDEFHHSLTKINEAGLVLRNMSLLEDNAEYLSRKHPLRDFLSVALNLPTLPSVTELQHYALDIAEQLTKYWSLDVSDPLYLSLLKQLDGIDRGAILTALRAISRISMNLEESNRLKDVPISIIKRICEWVLLDDEELVHSCLDFLYQYTAVPDNVALLLASTWDNTLSLSSLLSQLVRLLLFNSHEVISKRLIAPATPVTPAKEIPPIPVDLLEQITKFDEPDRSSHWLRSCFEEDPESDITQIALWQAYQARFTEFSTAQNPLSPAADFIKNVSATFSTANAQVIPGPNPKFIIKGIRPRHVPTDFKGNHYSRCLWKPPGQLKACGELLLRPKDMWEHIVILHLRLSQTDGGKFDLKGVDQQQLFNCHWAGCRHFAATGGTKSPYEVGMHLKTHLPDTSEMASTRAKHNRSLPIRPSSHDPDVGSATNGYGGAASFPDFEELGGRDAAFSLQTWYTTATDERNDAAGLPLTSVLVLRNLARNIPKAAITLQDRTGDRAGKDKVGWTQGLFSPLKERLWFVIAHNKPLAHYVVDLMGMIERDAE